MATIIFLTLGAAAVAQNAQSPSFAEQARQALRRHDYANGLALAQKSSDQGDAAGEVLLGFIYAQGLGVSKDYARAMTLYRAAAEQGDADGQTKLGLMYNQGRGVPEDDAAAVDWYRKAAVQGNADAEHLLGLAYLGGDGVPKDYAQAMSWFKKAADQGIADAQIFIGSMYEQGQGVHRDYFEAIAWYRKAAEQGSEDAAKRLVAAERYVHANIPAALQFRCTLEGAPPIWKPNEENAAAKRYDDCLQKNLKRLGAEIK
jgi:TPR repeat protein